MPKRKKTRLNKKGLLVAAAVVLLLGLGLYVVKARPFSKKTPTATNPVNYGPATAQEKSETEQHKKDLAENQPSSTSTTAGKTNVKPVITYADQYGQNVEVGSYVAGIFENGGTCQLTLTKGSMNVERSATGVSSATTTNCPTFSVKVSDLTPGDWTAKVTYSSQAAEGTSDTKVISVH